MTDSAVTPTIALPRILGKATPTLDELTARAKAQFAEIAELDDAKAKIDEAYEMTKATKIISLGTTLNQIKRTLPHGKFRPWLAANFSGDKTTAARYMKCAELAKVAPVQHFNYSQLVQLLPLSSDELPAFLAALETAGISAAGLSKRTLGEYVKHWRKSHSLPTATPVIIDVTAKPAGKFVAVQPPPPRYEQPSLFANLPAPVTRPQLSLPAEIVAAAAEMGVPVFLILRAGELPANSVLVAPTVTANWAIRLRRQATAFIQTRIKFLRSDGGLKMKASLIFYTGTDIETFARAFAVFGDVDTPYKPKSSAALTAEPFGKPTN